MEAEAAAEAEAEVGASLGAGADGDPSTSSSPPPRPPPIPPPAVHALVHCFMGRSRSVTVAAAFACAELGMGAEEALATIRAAKPDAAPNQGFRRLLERWADSAEDAVEWGRRVKARGEEPLSICSVLSALAGGGDR